MLSLTKLRRRKVLRFSSYLTTAYDVFEQKARLAVKLPAGLFDMFIDIFWNFSI